MISLLELPHGTRTRKEEERDVGAALPTILADRGSVLILAAIFAGALVYSQAHSTFPLWVRALGFEEKVYGFLQGMNGILVAVFELAVTALAMRYPRTRMIALGVLLTGLGFGGFGILLSGLGMALAVMVWSFGEMFGSPSTAAFIADRAPAHLRGSYQRSLRLTYSLAFTIGPNRRHGDLRVVAARPLDRLRGTGSGRIRAGSRRPAVPGPENHPTPAGLTSRPRPAIYRTDIPGRYIGSLRFRREHLTCSNSRSWAS